MSLFGTYPLCVVRIFLANTSTKCSTATNRGYLKQAGTRGALRRRMRCPNPWLSCVLLLVSCSTGFGTTLEELRNDPDLTPERFASHFAGFKFHFRAEVQSPERFLASRSGDCDDYATLAAELLRDRGYNPQLVAVRMKKIVHVICYIPEIGGYLDYNERASANPIVRSNGSLADIAEKVSRSFGSPWTSASEFTFEEGRKRLVKTVLVSEHRPTA